MQSHKHALVLFNDGIDGHILLQGVARDFYNRGTKITLAHISVDYRELDIVCDAMTKDRMSSDIISTKEIFSHLAECATFPVDVKEIVTLNRFKEVNTFVKEAGVDLVIMGHQTRFLGMFSSYSIAFTNHLAVDVLIKHIPIN